MTTATVVRSTAPGLDRWDNVNLLCRDGDSQEVIALLKRRGVVTRLRTQHLQTVEVYGVLCHCTAAELREVDFRVSRPDRRSKDVVRVLASRSRRWSAIGTSGVACAVVLAAKLTRRPMTALTALASRYLLQGAARLEALP